MHYLVFIAYIFHVVNPDTLQSLRIYKKTCSQMSLQNSTWAIKQVITEAIHSGSLLHELKLAKLVILGRKVIACVHGKCCSFEPHGCCFLLIYFLKLVCPISHLINNVASGKCIGLRLDGSIAVVMIQLVSTLGLWSPLPMQAFPSQYISG